MNIFKAVRETQKSGLLIFQILVKLANTISLCYLQAVNALVVKPIRFASLRTVTTLCV